MTENASQSNTDLNYDPKPNINLTYTDLNHDPKPNINLTYTDLNHDPKPNINPDADNNACIYMLARCRVCD